MIMWLQKLCATQECDEHGVYDIECKLTLQQLSELLSIHITTCTKIVAALENEGVIERTRTRIRIFDAQRLAQYGLEDTPPGVLIAPMARSRACDLKEPRSAPIRDGRGARTTWRKTLTFPSLMQSETTHHRP